MENKTAGQFIYLELVQDQFVTFLNDEQFYQVDLVNKSLRKQNDDQLTNRMSAQEFNRCQRAIVLEKGVLINKSNPDLISVSFASIKVNNVNQTKNISAQSFTLDSSFLANKSNVLASNQLDLAYFKKYVLTNELRGLDIKYQELLYLLQNKYLKYLQIKINNILICKVSDEIMQITYEDEQQSRFQKYETYSYYLNIEDFFALYNPFISAEFYRKINDDEQQHNDDILSKALSSTIVVTALFQDEQKLIFKHQQELYYLELT